MNQDPAFDASIPVLTEVVTEVASDEVNPPAANESAAGESPAPEKAAGESNAAPVVADSTDSAPGADLGEQMERRAIDRWSGEQWSVMERRVTNRILQQLQGRVDFVLEQRLREGIHEAVERALGGLADELRLGLQDTLGEVVSRAVSQEIAHLQTLGK